jgi:rRNA-processing protein FCF1
MYSEETKSSALAKFLSVYDYVFVDTCSLMEDSFPTFMDSLTASREYWKDGFEVIVKGECVEELKKHSKSKDSQEARIEAKRALKILRHDKWHHRILTITKSNSNYGFADNAIFTEVSSLRIQKKVLIITQDKTLATDLRKLNQLDSQRGRFLAVYRITPTGELEENPGEVGTSSSRNYAGSHYGHSQNTSSSHAHGFLGRFNHKKEAVAPAVETPSQPVADENNPLVSADKRLCANLSNPNYAADRKAADIDAQISALEALDEASRNKLSLAYTLDELKQEKLKLATSTPKAPHPGEFERPLPPKKYPDFKMDTTPVPAPTLIAPKVEAKPQPKPFRKSWFEFGYSIQEALTKAGSHSSIIFRDASVKYFPAIHGPYDITSQDLDEVAKQVGPLKPGESKDIPLKGLVAHIEKTDKDWKASLEIPVKEEAKPANPAPIVAPAPVKEAVKTPVAKSEPATPVKATPAPKAKEASKPAVKAAKAPKTKAPKAEAKTDKPLKTPSKRTKKVDTMTPNPKTNVVVDSGVTAQDVNTAVPTGVTLLVGVPTNEEKKGFIERRARREANPDVAVAKNPNAMPHQSHQKTPHPSNHVAPKSAPKAAPAMKAKKVEAAPSGAMVEIVKEDKNLNAKINNPNYPVADKIKDLEAQLNKLRSIKVTDQKDLFFSAATIKTRLADLKKAK